MGLPNPSTPFGLKVKIIERGSHDIKDISHELNDVEQIFLNYLIVLIL